MLTCWVRGPIQDIAVDLPREAPLVVRAREEASLHGAHQGVTIVHHDLRRGWPRALVAWDTWRERSGGPDGGTTGVRGGQRRG